MRERWAPVVVVAVGVLLGARHPVRRACGVAALPAVLVLEGVRSWVQVGGTTYRPYWLGEAVAGVVIAGLLASRARAGRHPAGGPPSLVRRGEAT